MSALSTITHLAKAGQEIVAGDDIYGGSDRLLSQVCPKSGLVVKRIDTGNLDEVRAAVGPSTKIVWIESPTNPRQMISDIRVIYTTSLSEFLYSVMLSVWLGLRLSSKKLV
jgi:cystathionine beta-lyase